MTIQVFVSYRRGDSPHAAGRLVDRLDEHFKLFIDVDRIRPGADFTAVVREAVAKSDVLVAVIGLRWLTLRAENGGRRIDQPGDWVAEEIGTALRRGTLVIPVLVDGAQMPGRDELPPALSDLANRQALTITHESFAADSRRLIETIEEMVGAAASEPVNLWDDPDYPHARGAFLQGLWPAAIEGFERVLRRHPRQQRVMEQLEQARRSQHLLDLRATAESAAGAGRWQEVVDVLQAINALQPSDEIQDRLAQAQLRLRINELQNDVRALARTGNWRAVLAADAELARLDAGAADPDGLATKARAELLEAELAASYARAVKQLENHDWAGAESTLVGLLNRRPGYRDAEPLLALAQRKGKPERVQSPSKPAARKRAASRLIVLGILAALVVGTLVAITLRDPEPLLVDDFHTQAYGWEGQGGRYVNEMYRIDVDSRIGKTSIGNTSSPRNASNVYPSAPSDLRIEVDARSLDPLDNGSSYGVICRLNEDTNDRYQFTIGEGENTVRITKFLGGRAQSLAVASASLNATEANKIRADCVNGRDAEQGAVHLVFSLNGQIVAKVIDKDQPLLDGTIGVRAFSRQGGIRAAFDNFVVTPI